MPLDQPASQGAVPVISFRQALLEAQRQALREDPATLLMGLGVDDPKGIFGSTLDLHKEFGPERVFDLPLAENGMTGVAIGAALCGARAILVHQRADFLLLAMDQLVNHAAKWRYMFGGRQSIPLVVRAVIGRGWGQGAQHSQSLQSLFMHIPGLKVAMPSTPHDAKGLLLAAIDDRNPVIFLEHRLSYELKGEVPAGRYTVPLGKAAIRRSGKDVTIAAISYMAAEALQAAEALARDGIEVEVIDLRTLRPWDEELVLESVKKTGRLLVADTGWKTAGAGAEIAARIMELGFRYLKAPVMRIGLPEHPTPTSAPLEKAFYPGAGEIAGAIRKSLGRGAVGIENRGGPARLESRPLKNFSGPF